MRTRDRLLSLATAGVLLLSSAGVAYAAPKPRPEVTVVSEAGITAVQVARAGATDSQVEAAIQAYQGSHSGAAQASTGTYVINGTADYYSYCEEGTSGLMVWTNNSPSDCYGWYYEYLNGSRVSKVNMLKLKAAGGTAPNPYALVAWCDSHGTYCMVVSWIGQGLGAYLIGLLD